MNKRRLAPIIRCPNSSTVPFLILLVVFAFTLRVIFPSIYMTGADIPDHIMASLRLYKASPFTFTPLSENFFAQIFQFNHGYTTILVPFLQYYFAFRILGLSVTEPVLTFLQAFLGILSLLSVYFFVQAYFNQRAAFWSLLLLSTLPVHIGLSRVYAGQQILQILFFYLSSFFLLKLLQKRRIKDYWLYFTTLGLYTGADNAFFIGYFIHLLLIFWDSHNLSHFILNLKRTYFNHYILAVLGPLTIYLAITPILIHFGIHGGFLIRLFSKVNSTSNFAIDFVTSGKWALNYGGAVTFGFFLSLLLLIRRPKRHARLHFMLLFALGYFLIFSSSNQLESNYSIYFLIPVSMVTAVVLASTRYAWFLLLIWAANMFYACGIYYGLPLGWTPISNYGTVNRVVHLNDYGLKTLAYLIKTNTIPHSYTREPSTPIRSGREITGLFLDLNGADFYLGSLYYNHVIKSLERDYHKKYPNYLVGIVKFQNSNRNDYLKEFIKEHQLYHIATIASSETSLIDVYSNNPTPAVTTYYTETYNSLYDKHFANIDQMAKIYLGHF